MDWTEELKDAQISGITTIGWRDGEIRENVVALLEVQTVSGKSYRLEPNQYGWFTITEGA